jgi:hypothetical protein
MIPELRREFNAKWTPDRYRRFLELLDHGCRTHVKFRNCETPCFFPRPLIEKMARYGAELIHQLMTPAYLARSEETIPAEWRVPNESPRPMFIQVDFGLTAEHEPKLVEIQAFPSLYVYQPYLAVTYRRAYQLDPSLSAMLCDENEYWWLLRSAIVGDHDPATVVLLEIDPESQKTLPDFRLTDMAFGIRTVNITEVEKRGRRLFHNGVPIERIYNRAIVDELVRKNVRAAFDYRDDLDVEWAGHPNWYFRISKFSLPFLKHVSVPRTQFLSEGVPDDLGNWVLKPLYSFAGLGVVIGPSREDIARIADPSQYILQERVDFAPVIETPHGGAKAEIRMMYLWPQEENADLRALTTIIRMGRGKMMGVDHNRDLEWVGASAGFIAG